MIKRTLWLLLLFLWLTGCTGKVENAVLSPAPHEVISPNGLAENLSRRLIYWQGRLVYLDGKVVENDPITQLKQDKSALLGSYYKVSHNGRYLAYRYANMIANSSASFPGFPGVREKIGVWDLETGERKVLVEAGKDLPEETTIGGIAFAPDDSKVFFSLIWRDSDKTQHVDLATVDMASGVIERLGMDPLPVFSLDLDISPDGQWAVLAEAAAPLDHQVCLLIHLKKGTLDCPTFERGWYQSARFADNRSIVYGHSREIKEDSSILLSKTDGTGNKLLVSGLSSARILWVDQGEIVFSGATYDNYKCSSIYIINLDGSDFRRLSYLGQECLTDEELKKMAP
jgi:Tol biopolymer transport system component